MRTRRMVAGGAFAVAASALVFGLVLVFALGVPRLNEGRVGIGIAMTACGAIGALMGLVSLVMLALRVRRG